MKNYYQIQIIFIVLFLGVFSNSMAYSQADTYNLNVQTLKSPVYLLDILLNMKSEYVGSVPGVLFHRNDNFNDSSTPKNFLPSANVVYLENFHENSKKSENYSSTFYYNRIFTTDENVFSTIYRFIFELNGNTVSKTAPMPLLLGEEWPYPRVKILKFIPVASCIKVFNSDSFFPPQIMQESVILFSFQYSKSDTEVDDLWGIVQLKSVAGDAAKGLDSRWTVNHTYIKDETSQINKVQRSIKFFNEIPSDDLVKEFIESTDFGNNDVLNFTNYSRVFSVDIPYIVVYPPFKSLVEGLNKGLPDEKLGLRISIYNEVLVGLTSTQMIQ